MNQMELKYMKADLLIIKEMESENIIMKMVNIMLGSGKMILLLEKEQCIIRMEMLNMKVISSMANLMDMENFMKRMVNII